MFQGPLDHSIVSRAQAQKKIRINLVNFRKYTTDRHSSVDDTPYGGGAGMVIRVDVAAAALEDAGKGYKVLLSPKGERLNQSKVVSLSKKKHLVLLCGHYEGVDERVHHFVDEEISIGDYVLTGGELAAMVIIDAVARYVPGVLSKESLSEESHTQNLLEYPQYTRPPEFQGYHVPEVLLSGNHGKISAWRKEMALEKTRRRRKDLL